MSIIERVLDKFGDEDSQVSSRSRDDQNNREPAAGDSSQAPRDKVGEPGRNPEHQHDNQSEQSGEIDLDLTKLKKAGFLTPGSIKIVLSEQYRRIKRPILSNAFEESKAIQENRNLVLVTSSIPGEGKSFTSFNLALSIAREFNQTVLFIDADISKRSMSRFLGLDEHPGLTDYLMSDKPLGGYLLKTNVENLTILPAGTYYESTHELWATRKMRDLMKELSGRYNDRIIIIDSTPVLQDSSTHVLSRLTGQVLFVIEAEKTPQQYVTEALESIAESQQISLVLNKSNRRLVSDYGYYGHVNALPGAKKTAGKGSA